MADYGGTLNDKIDNLTFKEIKKTTYILLKNILKTFSSTAQLPPLLELESDYVYL